MKPFVILPATLLIGSASAATLAFVGGDTAAGTITGNPGNTVLDIGYMVPATNSTDPVLFETGGDGIGFMLAHVGNNLRVFQDQNSGAEAALSLDISGLAGQAISIRLDGDFTLANGSRAISLDVVPGAGTPLSISKLDITSADSRLSGSDGTGFGGINGSISGGAEALSGVQGFDVAARDIAGPGSSVLGADDLEGTIYTAAAANTQRGEAIPAASTYFVVPEPSSALLVLLGGLGAIGRHRR